MHARRLERDHKVHAKTHVGTKGFDLCEAGDMGSRVDCMCDKCRLQELVGIVQLFAKRLRARTARIAACASLVWRCGPCGTAVARMMAANGPLTQQPCL
eukprot:s2596_g6.t1